jgi:DNA end-binding protein Ku
MYYLLPDGPVGVKSYALIQKAMAAEGLLGVGLLSILGRERLILLRAIEELLTISELHYKAEVVSPGELADEVQAVEAPKAEREMARHLLSVLTKKDLDLGEYRDHHVEQMQKIITAKIEGRELVTPPPTTAPEVINLMDALKQSVRLAGGDEAADVKKPSRKAAGSVADRRPKKTRRKSG